MSIAQTQLTWRDEELAALLGHKPTESTWKPTLFLIARFREETIRLSNEGLKEERKKVREERVQALPDPSIDSVDPKILQGIAWALCVAALRIKVTKSVEHAMSDADTLLAGYEKRFVQEKP